jgi:hypothetical protein
LHFVHGVGAVAFPAEDGLAGHGAIFPAHVLRD